MSAAAIPAMSSAYARGLSSDAANDAARSADAPASNMAASNSNTSTASSLLATIAALDQNAVINSALSLPRLDSAALHGLLDLQSEAMLLRSVATSDCKSVIKQQTEAGQAPLTQIEEQLLQASPVPAAVKTEASHDANSPHYTSRPLNIVMLVRA